MSTTSQAYELNNPPVIAELLEGEIVAIDLDAGNYFSLRGQAAVMFNTLASGASPQAIVAAATGGDAPSLQRHLADFVDRCLADNLLRLRNSNGAVVTPPSLPPWSADTLHYELFTDMQNLLGLDPVHEADDKLGWPSVPATTRS